MRSARRAAASAAFSDRAPARSAWTMPRCVRRQGAGGDDQAGYDWESSTCVFRAGRKIKAIASELKLVRNTVRDIVRAGEASPAAERRDERAERPLPQLWLHGGLLCRAALRSCVAGERTVAAFAPLIFAAGEAYQFDWSHEHVQLDGQAMVVKVAQVRLCHSRMLYDRAYLRKATDRRRRWCSTHTRRRLI